MGEVREGGEREMRERGINTVVGVGDKVTSREEVI